MNRDNKYPRYKYDVFIRPCVSIVAAYIAAQHGGDEGFLKLIYTRAFAIEYAVTLLITLLVVHLIYFITWWLDRNYDWHERPLLRVPLQLLLGIIVPDLIVFTLAASYFNYYDRNIFEYNYDNTNLQFNTALIILFNVYYYIRYLLEERSYLYQQVRLVPVTVPAMEEDREEIIEVNPGTISAPARAVIMVHTPTRTLAVPTGDIAYFYREQGRVFLRPFSGNDLILSQSLDALEGQLDPEQFFRAARQMIVNRAAIEGYQNLLHGKLGLLLSPPYKPKISVSKPAAPAFKSWLNR